MIKATIKTYRAQGITKAVSNRLPVSRKDILVSAREVKKIVSILNWQSTSPVQHHHLEFNFPAIDVINVKSMTEKKTAYISFRVAAPFEFTTAEIEAMVSEVFDFVKTHIGQKRANGISVSAMYINRCVEIGIMIEGVESK